MLADGAETDVLTSNSAGLPYRGAGHQPIDWRQAEGEPRATRRMPRRRLCIKLGMLQPLRTSLAQPACPSAAIML